jgi:hypothetical protein
VSGTMRGGCRCGRIRYEVTGEPLFSLACHCTDCQHLSASAFSLGLAVAEGAFALAQGEPRRWTRTGSSGRPSHWFTCDACGTWTHTIAESAAGLVIVRPTSLDEHRWFRPVAQIFTRSALPWARMPVPLSYETEFDDPSTVAAVYAAAGIRP